MGIKVVECWLDCKQLVHCKELSVGIIAAGLVCAHTFPTIPARSLRAYALHEPAPSACLCLPCPTSASMKVLRAYFIEKDTAATYCSNCISNAGSWIAVHSGHESSDSCQVTESLESCYPC